MLIALLLAPLTLLSLLSLTDGGGGDGGDGGGSDDGDAGGDRSDGDDKGDKGGDDTTALKRTLDKVRDEKKAAESARKAAETSLREMQGRLDAIEGKDKSEAERLATERDRLIADLEAERGKVDATTKRLREQAVTVALTNAATKAGARYPDLLVERLAKGAELDDELNVANADALVAGAKKDYPDLFRVSPGRGDGGARDEAKDDATIRPGLARMQVGYATESKTATTRRR